MNSSYESMDRDDAAALETIMGPKPVMEALRGRPERLETVFLQEGRGGRTGEVVALCREQGIRYKLLPRERMDHLFPGNHQGVAARSSAVVLLDLATVLARTVAAGLPVVLALDQVQDPGNVGTLARTMAGLGAGGMILPKDRAAPLGLGAAKASAGTLAKVPMARVVNLARALEQCREQGFMVFCAMQGEGSRSVYAAELQLPAVLVLGNEDRGIRQGVAKTCDQRLQIPLPGGLDSLNVAQAGAIILGEFHRRRLG
jgi:23S rRNA (guanosine2251-2'-O)-methyltransferase